MRSTRTSSSLLPLQFWSCEKLEGRAVVKFPSCNTGSVQSPKAGNRREMSLWAHATLAEFHPNCLVFNASSSRATVHRVRSALDRPGSLSNMSRDMRPTPKSFPLTSLSLQLFSMRLQLQRITALPAACTGTAGRDSHWAQPGTALLSRRNANCCAQGPNA